MKKSPVYLVDGNKVKAYGINGVRLPNYDFQYDDTVIGFTTNDVTVSGITPRMTEDPALADRRPPNKR